MVNSPIQSIQSEQVVRVFITPAFAKRLLQFNTENRPFKKNHGSQIKDCLENDEYFFNGQTIQLGHATIPGLQKGQILDENTEIVCVDSIRVPILIDGQHRLIACVEAGVALETLLFCNPYPDKRALATIDNTRQRGGADHLAMMREKNYTLISASLRVVLNFNSDFILSSKNAWSNKELEEGLKAHPGIRDSVGLVAVMRIPVMVAPPSLLAAFHYLFSKKDSVLANRFICRLIDGVGLPQDSPILKLRMSLLQGRLNSKHNMKSNHISALIIKAWNYERRGKTLKVLRFNETGDAPESFPVIR